MDWFCTQTYEEIYEYVKALTIVDTHEHLPGCEQYRGMENDVISEYLIHYFSCDLISAGLSPENLQKARGTQLSLGEKWSILAKYWNVSRHTGYGRSLDITASALYGIPRIDGDTIEELDKRFREARAGGNCYQRVLKEKCNIEISVLDYNLDCDQRYFRSMYQINHFLMPSEQGIKELESAYGVKISSFSDFLEVFIRDLDHAYAKGCVGIKTNCAYWRPLFFEKTEERTAQRLFEEKNYGDSRFFDYMIHYTLAYLEKKGGLVQLHTGIQEGNGNTLQNSNPILLNNLFLAYPNVRFVLMHIGYPFEHTLSALCKNFQNVYIDMCWAHIISPSACVHALAEYLDAVPYNKICAFGGDYCMLDPVYGHQYLARQDVAKSLAIKVAEGVFDVETAKAAAKHLLYENPKTIFNLKI